VITDKRSPLEQRGETMMNVGMFGASSNIGGSKIFKYSSYSTKEALL